VAALAEELREIYPEPARKIAELFGRIAVNNEALAELHRDRPAGVMEHLLSAELHASGVDSFTYNMPSLLTSVVLFDWDTGRRDRRRWQRRPLHPWCQLITPPTGQVTTSGAPPRSSGSDSVWLISTRAKLSSKRSARMHKPRNVSLRASARSREAAKSNSFPKPWLRRC
jgi:hypothetical protein